MVRIKKKLKSLNLQELRQELDKQARRQFDLRSEQAIGRLTKTAELWKTRKTIAIAKAELASRLRKQEG